MLVASAAQGVHSRRDCGKIAFEIPILSGTDAGSRPRTPGTQRARTVVIDAILPVLMLYAQHSPDTALREHLLACYHTTPRLPDNHLLRYMHHRMLGNDPALLVMHQS